MLRASRAALAASLSRDTPIGFIGLGHMGKKMVLNLANDGWSNIAVYDRDSGAAQAAQQASPGAVSAHADAKSIAKASRVVISMLPNDSIVTDISEILLKHSDSNESFNHISCSTISPVTSRAMAKLYSKRGKTFTASPVFARPDGLARREATWMVSGGDEGKEQASALLSSMGKIVDFGSDAGAANIVKLCGNFLIASSIESISEAMALAEKHGVDQRAVMDLLSSTIFNCLIYKGYGSRVSNRDHRPGGFSLNLGLKDVSLVQSAAKEADVPMPFLSTLVDRFTSSKARGRGDFDWSAIGLAVAEDAGISVAKDVARTRQEVKERKFY